ncbi:MAG: hypothetical protein GQE15_31835 [Archangiaceae bacterium]|nr:hypothetical protein [Archangiaceae bacterium]
MNRLRSWAPGVVPLIIGLVALWYFHGVVAAQDPLSNWVVGRYLGVMLLAGLWGGSAWCGGFFVTERLKLTAVPLRERLVFSFALGLLAWALLVVAMGLLGVLGKAMFFAMPLFFYGLGGLPLLKTLRRASRLRRHVRARPPRVFDRVLFGLGLIGVALIWVNLLTPRNLMYDARWYHLSLAEQFAVSGRVYRLDEGWFNGTMPHLTTWLQTWSFLSPFGQLFDRLELAAHLEFVVFLATLASLPVLIDALLPRPRLGSSWALRFLFPGVLLYDSSLGGGADHVLAFWAVPLFLALRRFWKRPTTAHGVLFGAFAGAAALTKYQALFLLMGPGLAVTARVGLSVIQKARRDFLKPALVTAGAALAISSPHWALNALWHHNPVYPYLSNVCPSTPMSEGIEPHISEVAWQPKGTTKEKLLETAKATLRFGFESHDWDTFHGNRPVYGSLFLVAMALLAFAFRRRAVLALGLSTWVAVPLWYWTQHQDRYLQAIAPWCTVVVAVVFAGVWRRFVLARPAVVGLVGLQVLHAADLPTLPAHSTLNAQPVTEVLSLLSSNDGAAPEKLIDGHYSISRIDKLIPREAKVLVHEVHIHLGLQRAAVRDHVQRQGAIAYSVLGDTGSVIEKLRSLGVTHVLWTPTPAGQQLIGDDLVFLRFTQHAVTQVQSLNDGFVVGAITGTQTPKPQQVLVLTCTTEHLSPKQLQLDWHRLYYSTCETPPAVDIATMAANEDVVIVDTRRYPGRAPLDGSFTMLFDRNGFNVWSRKP